MAHVFGKYADLAKTLHAVSWLNKVTYFSKENDDCECVEPRGIGSWHTCSRNTSILLKKAFSWSTSSHWEATLCTRVRERSQVLRPRYHAWLMLIYTWLACSRNTTIFVEERILLDHFFPLGGNTLHTCSRKEPSSPPGEPHFTHVFEKGAKFAAGEGVLYAHVREIRRVRGRGYSMLGRSRSQRDPAS